MKHKSKQQSRRTIILGVNSDTFGAYLNGFGVIVALVIMAGIGKLSMWAVSVFELHGPNALLVGVLPIFLLMPVVYLVIYAFLKKAP